MRRLATAVATAAVLAWTGGASDGQTAAKAAPSIADLAWLAGNWQTAPGAKRQSDEHWTPPLGGAMLGTSRTIADGKMTEFEYLRIVQRADGLVYIAHPNARVPGTEFRLAELSATRAVFQNPQHDFPKRIVYQKLADGSLVATADGGEGTRGPTFHYRPMRTP